MQLKSARDFLELVKTDEKIGEKIAEMMNRGNLNPESIKKLASEHGYTIDDESADDMRIDDMEMLDEDALEKVAGGNVSSSFGNTLCRAVCSVLGWGDYCE